MTVPRATPAKPPAKKRTPAKRTPRPKPLRLAPQTADSIVRAVAMGMERDRAAQAYGVASLAPFLEADKALAARIDQASAEAELRALTVVASRGEEWQASKWLLERLNPERWGKTAIVQHVPAARPGVEDPEVPANVISESRVERARREREERARDAAGSVG